MDSRVNCSVLTRVLIASFLILPESTRVVDASGVIVAVVSHEYAFVDVLA